MLDNETKRRIDTARDILVGKVPDPKSQVEQITIALVYKFMDDIDQESVDMGGKASFFTGEYEKYAWSRIFDPRLGGYEMLGLYADAITRLAQNPNLPQLFRDIFKNAYLPYRDPETLKLFLKTINDFRYDHSERLGDAFEYLLSVMSSQGDAGQFRTPRHLIDFMVQIVNPQKNETILDPACGTAGFLISAYKHIMKENSNGNSLTVQERMDLLKNFKGYDISPDMVRLSLVNLYLHGFQQPQIYEYDTLTSEDRWNEYADVILANPPFMSPKGGIRPHKRFTVQSNRSEVLFVDYMAEHLTPNGRAAIIVPEGILFQAGNAYKQLRKYLLDQCFLISVISLPVGIFKPYSDVKTAILIFDKPHAKKTDEVLFVKIVSDGTDLGTKRKKTEINELPGAVDLILTWINNPNIIRDLDDSGKRNYCDHIIVEKKTILEHPIQNYSMELYRKIKALRVNKYPLIELSELIKEKKERARQESLTVWSVSNKLGFINSADYFDKEVPSDNLSAYKIVEPGHFAYNPARINVGSIALNTSNHKGAVSPMYIVFDIENITKLDPKYLFLIMKSDALNTEIRRLAQGAVRSQLIFQNLKEISIPVPPIEVQREIVAEIEGYQRIIGGAQQVVDNWKPNIEWELEEERRSAGVDAWPVIKLGDVCEKVADQIDPKTQKGEVIYIGLENIDQNNGLLVGQIRAKYEDIKSAKNKFSSNDILYGKLRPNLNKVYLSKISGICSTDILVLRAKNIICPEFMAIYLRTPTFNTLVLKGISGSQLPRVSFDYLADIQIPLPTRKIQEKIIENIQKDVVGIEANQQLIQVYEERIRKVIERVWEG